MKLKKIITTLSFLTIASFSITAQQVLPTITEERGDNITLQQLPIGLELEKAGDCKMTSLKLKATSAGFGLLAYGFLMQENKDGTSYKNRISTGVFILSATIFTISIPFDFMSAQHLRNGGMKMQNKTYSPHL